MDALYKIQVVRSRFFFLTACGLFVHFAMSAEQIWHFAIDMHVGMQVNGVLVRSFALQRTRRKKEEGKKKNRMIC